MSNWSKLRILLCDTDVHYRTLTFQMLRERAPGALAELQEGVDDRKLIARFRPTLVVFGITQEDQSCLKLVRWLRTPGVTPVPGVSVLLMADGISDETVKRSIYMGVDYFVTKPTSPSILHQRIDKLLLQPLQQYHTPDYTGPDRRRLPSDVYSGPDRRQRRQGNRAAA